MAKQKKKDICIKKYEKKVKPKKISERKNSGEITKQTQKFRQKTNKVTKKKPDILLILGWLSEREGEQKKTS